MAKMHTLEWTVVARWLPSISPVSLFLLLEPSLGYSVDLAPVWPPAVLLGA